MIAFDAVLDFKNIVANGAKTAKMISGRNAMVPP
jgi:hypothetical protein